MAYPAAVSEQFPQSFVIDVQNFSSEISAADTMCGALLRYITTPTKDFQPMGANMGLLPAPETRIRDKRQRYLAVAQRAVAAMERYLG